jgi:Xaa-Pro dipeptidase
MDAAVYFKRIEKVREGMAEKGIDAFLVSPSSNLFYLCGYDVGPDERLFLLALPRDGDPFILANLLYKEQMNLLPVKDQVFWKDGDDPFALLSEQIKNRNIRTAALALEPQIPALFSLPLRDAFPDTRFVLGSILTTAIRQIKDEEELFLIRRACRESDRALASLIDKGGYWLGKTETDFYTELGAEFNRGGLGFFGASVQAGANAAIPHYTTGTAPIKNGNCLLVDFWGRYKGYYTDCTRTFYVGKPDSEFEKIYAIVLEAHLAAQEKAVPGNNLEDIDMAARSVIEKYGYGDFFTHRTGHGLGIDVHEGDPVNTGVKAPILPGMVFSIEPGIYLPGRFGIRIENLVAIGETGPEILHNYPRELTLIGQ